MGRKAALIAKFRSVLIHSTDTVGKKKEGAAILLEITDTVSYIGLEITASLVTRVLAQQEVLHPQRSLVSYSGVRGRRSLLWSRELYQTSHQNPCGGIGRAS